MEDGSAVLIHILKHGSELNCNPASMSLGGISAGGHLSAVMQHMARDAGIPLKLGESPWVGLYVGYPNLTTSLYQHVSLSRLAIIRPIFQTPMGTLTLL
jgi:acetyl esterase/lipase